MNDTESQQEYGRMIYEQAEAQKLATNPFYKASKESKTEKDLMRNLMKAQHKQDRQDETKRQPLTYSLKHILEQIR